MLGRLWQILQRCGAWLLAEPWRRPEDAQLAAELRHGLVDLGPSFVRLGRQLAFFVDPEHDQNRDAAGVYPKHEKLWVEIGME